MTTATIASCKGGEEAEEADVAEGGLIQFYLPRLSSIQSRTWPMTVEQLKVSLQISIRPDI